MSTEKITERNNTIKLRISASFVLCIPTQKHYLELYVINCAKIKWKYLIYVEFKVHNFVFCLPCISLWFLVNDQLDAQFFYMYLFQFSTWFLVYDQRDAQILFYVFISIYNSLHV